MEADMKVTGRGWLQTNWDALNERFHSRAWDYALAGMDQVAQDEETGEVWQMMGCYSRPVWMGDYVRPERYMQYRVEYRHRCRHGAREYRRLSFVSDPTTGDWYNIRVEVVRQVYKTGDE
jgi:hypothetical protein